MTSMSRSFTTSGSDSSSKQVQVSIPATGLFEDLREGSLISSPAGVPIRVKFFPGVILRSELTIGKS